MFSRKSAEVPSKIPEPNETTKVLEDYLLFQSEDLNITDEKIVTPKVVSEMTLGTTTLVPIGAKVAVKVCMLLSYL